jgi:ABC-type nitrate/sulfonate/bicarbonate transport system permease component
LATASGRDDPHRLAIGNLMQTDQLMAGIAAIAVHGLMIGAMISWLDRALLGWR